MKMIFVLTLSLMLGGCGTTSLYTTSTGQVITETMVISKCPVLKQYTPEQLQKAADELGGLPDDSVIVTMIGDYSKTREACRKITQQLKK